MRIVHTGVPIAALVAVVAAASTAEAHAGSVAGAGFVHGLAHLLVDLGLLLVMVAVATWAIRHFSGMTPADVVNNAKIRRLMRLGGATAVATGVLNHPLNHASTPMTERILIRRHTIMSRCLRFFSRAVMVLFVTTFAFVNDGHAFGSYGDTINASCVNRIPPRPYNGDCALCHQGSKSNRVEPEWSWWETGQYTQFCPGSGGPANQPPDVSTIDSPADGAVFQSDTTVTFQATGHDPEDGNNVTFSWNFGGVVPNATGNSPQVTLVNTGTSQRTVTVTLTVRDSQGLAVTDTIQLRIDPADTGGVPPTACSDVDGDGFSPEGAFCGPVDTEPTNAAVNPGVYEVCDDTIDNDGDGLVDLADEECQSCDNRSPVQLVLYGECRFANAPGPGPGPGDGTGLSIRRASWESGDGGKLKAKGRDAPGGATVQVANADTNEIVATVRAGGGGEWEIEKTGVGPGPCRVKAGVNGVFGGAVNVRNAPANCIGGVGTPGGTPSENVPVVRGSDWRAGESALRVSGGYDFAPGTTVTVLNADTGSVVGTTTVRSDGEFRFKAEGMQANQVPCGVKVEVDGLSSNTVNVENAPANCDDGTPGGDDDGTPGDDDDGTGTGLTIETARYRYRVGGTLIFTGAGAPGGATVQVANADTNEIVATVVASSNGDWEYNEQNAWPGPCRVKAGVNGVFGDPVDVFNAPTKCVGSP